MKIDSSKLIFVVGCPRSGTTKLTDIINRHSSIVSSSETHFFNINWDLAFNKDLEDFISSDKFSNFLEHFRIQDFLKLNKLSQEVFIEEFKKNYSDNQALSNLSSKDIYLKSLFDVIVSLSLQNDQYGASIFCEKTPQHIRSVDKILYYYPEAKFIHVIRDGRDVVNSLLKMPWRPDGLINNARFWKKFVKFGFAMQNHLEQNGKQNQWFNLRYEELLESPEEVLHLMCDFLGLEYEAAMLENDEILDSKVYADWESKWKHKVTLDLDMARIGAYKKEMPEDDQITLNWFIQKELEELSYEVDMKNLSYKHLNFAVKSYIELASHKLLRFLSDLV